ncbi:glycoside hydrolase family 51 protein [Tulasnella calospora MUT 4182]|uniref:Glycoside hydrolase family 51 protein n=1 Tax=Tulasnella calospora MUT 4182 TaxID=1051891 RepID=A0A0C3L716_9AGAM|nr:glycoside hydrolase family 51 protein [Tulasnella calospora MUT 4182]
MQDTFSFSSTTISSTASGLILLYFLRKCWSSKPRPPLPPGPKGLPFIGNLLDFPRKQFVLTFLQWGEQYGPITWVMVPGRKFLIVNSYEAMRELLDKRGSNYINRPQSVMVTKLMKTDFTTVRLQGEARWRRHRKFLRPALSLNTVKQNYSDLFLAKASGYLQAILHKPDNFHHSLRRALGETISELTHGAIKHQDGTDYVTEHEENFAYSKRAAMGYLVDLFPLLRFIPSWFPGAKFRRDAQKWGQHGANLRKMMIEGVEQRMATNEGRPCYVSNMLEDLQKLESDTGEDIREDVQAVHDSGFSFYQGTSKILDQTATTLKNFLLAMSLYPDVQARAHKEIEQFFVEGRSPDFSSQDQMPYIRAIVLESLRWNPPVSFGVPHTAREDNFYNGYFIPKGTTVIANQWQVSRDPMIYDDPSTFNPDRFIDNPDILDPRDFVFGFGRRICPGNSLAYQLTWIFVVSILWGFEIQRPEGCPPLERDADRFDFGLIRYAGSHFLIRGRLADYETFSTPYPFPCTFIPRANITKGNAPSSV